jgi:RES domain-containing protein
MEVFRLSREKYSRQLSGEGTAIGGGRWDSIGTELVYTASNRSLAMAEVAVHLALASVPEDFLMLTINVPASVSVQMVSEDDLPFDWQVFPYAPASQTIGDRFIAEGKYCVLRVPSAVTRGDYNFLINPHHRQFEKIKITGFDEFPFDRRLIR